MIRVLILEPRVGDFDHDPYFDFGTKSKGFDFQEQGSGDFDHDPYFDFGTKSRGFRS